MESSKSRDRSRFAFLLRDPSDGPGECIFWRSETGGKQMNGKVVAEPKRKIGIEVQERKE